MECHYNISVTPWFLIQPSLLWISNPAGRDDTGNATARQLIYNTTGCPSCQHFFCKKV